MSHQNSAEMLEVMRGSCDKVIRDFAGAVAKAPENHLAYVWAAIGTDCAETREALLDLLGVSKEDAVSALDPYKRVSSFDTIHTHCREITQIAILGTGSASLLH